MSEWAARRFWKETMVAQRDGGFAILLDGRPVRTPAKRPLLLPTPALADSIAAEWDAQAATVDPLTMPVTRAANAALDKMEVARDDTIAGIAAYGASDLLCHRAETPEMLVRRQRQAWDPLLDWAADTFGARLHPVAGVMPANQPQAALDRLTAEVGGFSNFGLTALAELVSISGSLVIGLAVAHRRLTPDTAWALSRIDEDWQQENWGADDEASAHAALRNEALVNAHRFLRLCGAAARH